MSLIPAALAMHHSTVQYFLFTRLPVHWSLVVFFLHEYNYICDIQVLEDDISKYLPIHWFLMLGCLSMHINLTYKFSKTYPRSSNQSEILYLLKSSSIDDKYFFTLKIIWDRIEVSSNATLQRCSVNEKTNTIIHKYCGQVVPLINWLPGSLEGAFLDTVSKYNVSLT